MKGEPIYGVSFIKDIVFFEDLRILLANWPDIWEPTFLGNTCLVALSIVPIQVMCLGPKVGIWGLTQGRMEQFQFWVQGKNESICPTLFFNFLSIS